MLCSLMPKRSGRPGRFGTAMMQLCMPSGRAIIAHVKRLVLRERSLRVHIDFVSQSSPEANVSSHVACAASERSVVTRKPDAFRIALSERVKALVHLRPRSPHIAKYIHVDVADLIDIPP